MGSTTKMLSLKVARKNPELIAPAKPTPHEFKLLSDIDNQETFRAHVVVIQFFPSASSAEGKDPAKVLRVAIAKALVFYYPLAGRLRERTATRKLVVECTGEGVIFIEADADVTLHQFKDAHQYPPFPYTEDLFQHAPATSGVLDSPLLLFQVTRLKCGGFVLAVCVNHVMCDAVGLGQFMSAVAEFSRGAGAPSVLPVWERRMLCARSPPRLTCTHREYDDSPSIHGAASLSVPDNMVSRSFFFGAAEFAALRSGLPPHLRGCTRFELLMACIWRCRTIAISPEANEEVRMMVVVNARQILSPPLPDGYYGNALACPVAIASAGDLVKNPVHYAVELVREAKAQVTDEYVRSTMDLMEVRGGPPIMAVQTYWVADQRHAEFEHVDYGWGKPAYTYPSGPVAAFSYFTSYYLPFKNDMGEEGTLVPMCLPSNAMDIFTKELYSALSNPTVSKL